MTAVRVHLPTRATESLWQSTYGAYVAAWTPDLSRIVLVDGYTIGDVVLYEIDDAGARRMLFGTPIEERDSDAEYPLTGFRASHGTVSGAGCSYRRRCTRTGARSDTSTCRGPARSSRSRSTDSVTRVTASPGGARAPRGRSVRADVQHRRLLVGVCGLARRGGAAVHDRACAGGRGRTCRRDAPRAPLRRGQRTVRRVVLYRHEPDAAARAARDGCGSCDTHAASALWASHRACSRRGRADASFESHDGLRVSARLYLPSPELGYDAPRPLVYYVHGGPQSQERPNFAWFSMPLIQILTLEGFAVFVPNVRGSTGTASSTRNVSTGTGADWIASITSMR